MFTNFLFLLSTITAVSATYNWNCPAGQYFSGHRCVSFCQPGFEWTGRTCRPETKCAKTKGGCGSGEKCCGDLTCQWYNGNHRVCLPPDFKHACVGYKKGCGSGETCCSGTTCQWYNGNHRVCLPPDFKHACVKTNGGCGAGETCCSGTTCQWAAGNHRLCLPPPGPKITSCSRRSYKLHYSKLPVGAELVARNPKTGACLTHLRVGPTGTVTDLSHPQGQWFHRFRLHPFELAVITNGVTGPYATCTYNTPIALDLDHSGNVESVEVTLDIDISGNGVTETVHEWFAPTEGILIDTSVGIVDGVVTGQHMFGDMEGKYLHGYEKLTALRDDDKNGVIEGIELKGLALWTDKNSNGKLDNDDELSQLSDHGIVSLNTEHVDFVSNALLEDGSNMVMEDMWFA